MSPEPLTCEILVLLDATLVPGHAREVVMNGKLVVGKCGECGQVHAVFTVGVVPTDLKEAPITIEVRQALNVADGACGFMIEHNIMPQRHLEARATIRRYLSEGEPK
jgi:hypothetical protein